MGYGWDVWGLGFGGWVLTLGSRGDVGGRVGDSRMVNDENQKSEMSNE